MNNKRFFIIGSITIIILVIGIITALISPKSSTKIPPQNTASQSQFPVVNENPGDTSTQNPIKKSKNQPQTTLFLFPNPIAVDLSNGSASATIELRIDTLENEITKAQIELSFEKNTIQSLIINPLTNTFLKQAKVTFSQIDPANGKALFVIQSDTPQKGKGTLATLTLITTPNFMQTLLRFSSLTQVTNAKDSTNLLMQTVGTKVIGIRDESSQ